MCIYIHFCSPSAACLRGYRARTLLIWRTNRNRTFVVYFLHSIEISGADARKTRFCHFRFPPLYLKINKIVTSNCNFFEKDVQTDSTLRYMEVPNLKQACHWKQRQISRDSSGPKTWGCRRCFIKSILIRVLYATPNSKIAIHSFTFDKLGL